MMQKSKVFKVVELSSLKRLESAMLTIQHSNIVVSYASGTTNTLQFESTLAAYFFTDTRFVAIFRVAKGVHATNALDVKTLFWVAYEEDAQSICTLLETWFGVRVMQRSRMFET